MKSIAKIALCAAVISLSLTSFAQQKKEKVGQVIKKDAKAVGNETAELAVKGTSKIADKTYAGKVGPKGQTIYINRHAKYYYVSESGKKMYVTKAQLRNKPAKK